MLTAFFQKTVSDPQIQQYPDSPASQLWFLVTILLVLGSAIYAFLKWLLPLVQHKNEGNGKKHSRNNGSAGAQDIEFWQQEFRRIETKIDVVEAKVDDIQMILVRLDERLKQNPGGTRAY